MAFLFRKFQQAAKSAAKSPMFGRDPRNLQFETDINRLFLYTSYNRLGENAEEKDAEELIEMATRASVSEQQMQVHENVHFQIKNISQAMDGALVPDVGPDQPDPSRVSPKEPQRKGLSFAVGKGTASSNIPDNCAAIPATRHLTRHELSQAVKDQIGYTLDIKPSQVPHKDAGQGLFISGQAQIGSVLAFYPGVIYSPAYYRYIPGYPRIDASNSYLINRYDGNLINAQPWGTGGSTREYWDGTDCLDIRANNVSELPQSGSDRMWRILSNPLDSNNKKFGDLIERRNPLAFAHFANHPPKDTMPNAMVCAYDFPLSEKDMRVYIPNVVFGGSETANMKRFGTFWFKSWSGSRKTEESETAVIRALVLVATRIVCDEEVYLNYRLSNAKRRPEWYVPVDSEEDKRRWS
ncbi:C5orf35 [Rhynchospora pubera]|uniref:C5orf35 n=1 Tax=Rhynchospora pubera TaxID=906938 RepID=A0AAV8BWL3_9POAL|nr:C5orf35 [Rhynchospora pubera]